MGRTPIKHMHATQVAKKTGGSPTVNKSSYVVPTAKTLRVSSFTGGYEYTKKEARIELTWDGGIVAVGYSNGSNFQMDVNEDFEGDGTKKMEISLINGDSGEMHMSAWWKGVIL